MGLLTLDIQLWFYLYYTQLLFQSGVVRHPDIEVTVQKEVFIRPTVVWRQESRHTVQGYVGELRSVWEGREKEIAGLAPLVSFSREGMVRLGNTSKQI